MVIGLLSYLGSFGEGRAVIPFGWDFLVIAVISWLVFAISQRCALGAEEAEEQINEALELL